MSIYQRQLEEVPLKVYRALFVDKQSRKKYMTKKWAYHAKNELELSEEWRARFGDSPEERLARFKAEIRLFLNEAYFIWKCNNHGPQQHQNRLQEFQSGVSNPSHNNGDSAVLATPPTFPSRRPPRPRRNNDSEYHDKSADI